MNWMQRWYRFTRADRLGRSPRQRREAAARRKRPVPGADAPPSATTAGSGANYYPVRAPAPGSAHAPSRKVVDIRTCGCVYVWDRGGREWSLVACGATPARFAAAVEQWLKDGAP